VSEGLELGSNIATRAVDGRAIDVVVPRNYVDTIRCHRPNRRSKVPQTFFIASDVAPTGQISGDENPVVTGLRLREKFADDEL
jgi:hypothetical protein